MKPKILIIFFFVFCFLFSFNSVLAIGIGAEPSSLDLGLERGQSKIVKILVYNISQEAGIFQVFPDELNEWMKITPDNFRLEAGENKEIEIKVLAKEEGRKAINLSISASSLNRQSFSISPGLKIPLRLDVGEKEFLFLASISAILKQSLPKISIGIIVILLIGFFLIKYFKRRKRIVAPPKNLPVETSSD